SRSCFISGASGRREASRRPRGVREGGQREAARCVDCFYIGRVRLWSNVRVLLLLVVSAATSLVLGAWASASDVVPTCAGHLQKTMCLRGSALVRFKGITYRMKGSRCYVGAKGGRLYFGPQDGAKAKNDLYLVVEPNRVGAVDVIDGGL